MQNTKENNISIKHPRFLGFLWHSFGTLKNKPCTKKCEYCPKIKHKTINFEMLSSVPIASSLPHHGVEGYERRKCICGRIEKRYIETGPTAGFDGPWEEEIITNDIGALV